MSADQVAPDPDAQARHALDIALQLAAAGYLLTAVTIRRRADGKKGATFHGNGHTGTAFRGWRHEDAWTSDAQQLTAWWVDHPDTSFAVRTGAIGGVDVVDLDVSDGHDAVAWWATEGHPFGGARGMVVTTPSGGMHLYARADGLPTGAGVFAPGVDTRGDGGLVFAPGGYVVGEAGHYDVQGDLVAVAELTALPAELADAIRSAAPESKTYAADGEVIVKDRPVIINKCREQLGALATMPPRTGGSLFRDAQMGAAMMLGRLVEAGAADHSWAVEQLERATVAVWGSISAADTANILSGLADGPRKERWRFRPDPPTTAPQPAQVGGLTRGTAPVSAAATDHTSVHAQVSPPGLRVVGDDEDSDDRDVRELELARKVYELDLAQEARRRLAARDRPPLQVLDAATFLDAPQPEYLVPGLLYRDSTAKVFGPPGGTKSFFLLDLALSLASGTPWHGVRLPRTRVHFVMAEGQAVNVARTLGWLHARGVDRAELGDGWFTAVPQGVLLTPEGIEQYRALVELEQPGLIILDTKNAMMIGEENSASDVAVMVRAMRELRDAAGGACVALVDHTGLGDASRGRGSNAVTAAMDTEVRVERDEGGVATAHVTRDKAAEPGREWSYRLTRVEDVPGLRPGATDPAVPMPADKHLSASIHAQDAWWAVPTEELPTVVQEMGGASGEAARDLFRALLYGGGDEGLSMPEVNRMLRERCPRKHGTDTLGNGRQRLLKLDIIEHGETASGGIADRRYRVAQHVLRALENA